MSIVPGVVQYTTNPVHLTIYSTEYGQNFKLFQLLQSSGALLGRTKTHIVLDRQAMPEIVDIVMLCTLDLRYED